MKKKLLSIIKYFKKVFIVFIITSIIVVILSKLFHFELSNMFLYIGVIYMIIGVSGNIGSTSGIGYIQAQSVSRSVSQNALDNFKDRDSSYDFLILMCVVGFLLLMIGLLYSKN